MKKEITKQIKLDYSIDGFIKQAIAEKLPIEAMERFFTLREKVKLEQAKEAYTEALANFQANCPIIQKTKEVMNKGGQTVRYKYAPIDAIVEQIKKPLAENGFAYTWATEQKDNGITATAKIIHKLGHSETSSFGVPIDRGGYMTVPQQVASALTFAKRYSLCNALGISTGDEDTDAVDTNPQPAPQSIKSNIVFLLRNLGQKTQTKEEIEKAVKELTQLDLIDKNFIEIQGRLEVLVSEKNEKNGN